MVLLLDDFHNIYTIRLPETNLKLSLATHLVSSLLEIQPTVQAINLPSEHHNIHCSRVININGKNTKCIGGIEKTNVKEIVTTGIKKWIVTYMMKVPTNYRTLNAEGLKRQLHEFR